MSSTSTSKAKPFPWAKAATIFSVCVALVLTLTKGVVWQQSGSVALLGSLADSLLDLVSSIVAFIGVRMASQPPDKEHRFGHEKAEAISSLVQLVLITGSAVFVLVESLRAIVNPLPLQHANAAIGVMLASLLLTTVLVGVQTVAIRRSGSIATESDRAHYLGDFLGNAGTLVAIFLATRFGLLRADGLAGLVAAGFLFWSVIQIARRALPQLMDEELPAQERSKILSLIMQDVEVAGVHALRTRQAGSRIYITLHLELDPDIPLRKAHVISDRVEARLLSAYPGADIMLHQDPYGYVEPHDNFGMPLSSDELEAQQQ